MTEITLDAIKEKQDELAAMISRLEEVAKKPTYFEYQGEHIQLNRGEIYVGTIITPTEYGSYHLILIPGEAKNINWSDAQSWAKNAGGALPNRVEGALLFVAQKSEFKEAWYWTRKRHVSNSDYAWCQHFNDGSQDYSDTDNEGRARAVRRVRVSNSYLHQIGD